MKKNKILIIYILAIIVYGGVVSLFTSTVHIGVDEELYLSLAKSFHYLGRFELNGEVADYNCVLYSMLISLAYYFYNPHYIIFLMRLIGVVVMCSAVFPVWKLSCIALGDEDKAIKLSAIILALPYMFDTAYIMQEILSYPLFLWTVYFGYRVKEKADNKALILMAVLSALCFFTKTYLFFIPVVVNLCFFQEVVKERFSKYLVQKIIAYNGIYIFCVLVMYAGIWKVNGGVKGSNHYAVQFSNIFPVTGMTIGSAIVGIIIYAAFVLINTGIFPIPALLFWRKKFTGAKRWLLDFTLLSILVLIVEIVVLIVLTEEGVPTVPHKFLFRYFQILIPLLLILYAETIGEFEFLKNRCNQILISGSILVSAVYFIHMHGNTRQAIMDGFIYLTIENATKYILSYIDVFLMIALEVGFVLLIVILCRNIKRFKHIYDRCCLAIIILLWIINLIQLPVYTNYVAGGKVIQDDSIKVAEYLNTNNYKIVYYVADAGTESTDYARNFYGYIRQPYCLIDTEKKLQDLLVQKGEKPIAVLSVDDYYNLDNIMKKVNLETRNLKLYILK